MKQKIQGIYEALSPVIFLGVVVAGVVCAHRGDADAAEKCFIFAGGHLMVSPMSKRKGDVDPDAPA